MAELPSLTTRRWLGERTGMQFRRRLGICSFALLLFHCGSDSEGEGAGVEALSLVTFNAALGVGLAPYLEQRLGAIEADLPRLGADVICLQEIWQPEDIERLTSALSSDYPFTHRSVQATGEAGSACTPDEASLLSSCLVENCAEVDRDGLPLCAIANCAATFTEVSASCQQCIAANQSAADVENLAAICEASDAGAVAYANQTGLLLLSRLPLEAPSYFAFESSLGDRGLLSARVGTRFMGDVDIHCTHLAATLREVPYTGEYGSWQGERLRQIDQMLERVSALRAEANPSGAAILLGDMNCGPGTPLAEAASPDAFERLLTAGFDAPYAESDGRCTFCGNNPLNGLVTDPEEGALIDHVLVSAPSEASYITQRVFDEVIPIEVEGMALETARSDHFGVQVLATAAASAGPATP